MIETNSHFVTVWIEWNTFISASVTTFAVTLAAKFSFLDAVQRSCEPRLENLNERQYSLWE